MNSALIRNSTERSATISANAQDGLADAYIAAGQKELARATLQQALKLIPGDAGLNEANKQYMTKFEQTKLDQLKP